MVIEGTLKDYVKMMMDTYKEQLGPYADSLQKMFEGMKESEQSEPMLKLLSCAASAHGSNTAKLEEQYQAQKRLKTELSQHQKQMSSLTTPAFSGPRERVVEEKKSQRAVPPLQSVISLPRSSRAGAASPEACSRSARAALPLAARSSV